MAAELQFLLEGGVIAPAPAARPGEARRARAAVPVMVPLPSVATSAALAPARAPAVHAPAQEAAPTDDVDGAAVRSVDRAAALLMELGACPAAAGVTELARRQGLHKSTASRLLATLERRGLVEQDKETGKYRLGLALVRLAEKAEATFDLRGVALPELARLARGARETVGLVTLDGEAAMTVAQVDGPTMAAVADWTGRATPLHSVAAGKVLLAQFAERDVLRLAKQGLEARTDRTITRLEPLLEELARVRRRDYATAFGEWEKNIAGVAVPVRDARGRVVAAVTVWGPSTRITPARVPDLVAAARTAAAAIGARLGGTG